MPKKAAQLDREIKDALTRCPDCNRPFDPVARRHALDSGVNRFGIPGCCAVDYHAANPAWKPTRPVHAVKKSTDYYVGAELRDELIREIDSLSWEGDDTDGVPLVDRAQKIKTALQSATAHRKGYLFDVDGWAWQDYDFLKMILVEGVAEDMGNTATSRGISLGGTLIGRQIRALREKL